MSTAPYGELFPDSILILLSPFLAAKAQNDGTLSSFIICVYFYLYKEAEAEAQAAEFSKKAAIAKAQGEAEAVKIEADATAYKNLKVAQNLSVMQAQWKHEEEMKRLEKWNGVQVSTQSVYVPNTYDLKSGK